MKNFLIFLLIAASMACQPAANNNTSASNSSTPVGSSANAQTPTPAQPKPTPVDESTVSDAEFAGTTANTDKKNRAGGAALLTDVRAGRHQGFDRIVFEFRGAELPGYHIEYIDKPVRSCGSGEVVPLAGDGWLQIRFEPANAHTEDGKPTLAFREIAPKLPVVLEMRSTCDFEARVEWVAGVSSPNRYRVLELKSPTRLVVDVKHT